MKTRQALRGAIVAAVCAGMFTCKLAGEAPKPTPTTTIHIGKYQLVRGTFKRLGRYKGKDSTENVDTIFRIDTSTGRTWYFEAGWAGDVEAHQEYKHAGDLWNDHWTEITERPVVE